MSKHAPILRRLQPERQHRSDNRAKLATSWFLGPPADFLASSDFPATVHASPRLVRAVKTASSGEAVDGAVGGNLNSEAYKKFLGKSLELLPSSSAMEGEIGPFRRETGIEFRNGEDQSNKPLHVLLENPESETRWYFKYFLGKVHHNYLCYDTEKSPFFLSTVLSGNVYRCILWRRTGNKRLFLKQTSNGKLPSPKSVLEKFSISKYEKHVKEVTAANVQKDLLTLEEQEGSVNFKFGVLYAKVGQYCDDEMFSNEKSSSAFEDFIDLLGDEVRLEGWKQFRGGLDNKNNSTGTTSVYTVFEGHEIMFHVSTMLPYTTGNKQQLERKRHIGNDIVVIIFIDDPDPEQAYQAALNFDPKCMTSHFNHIFALVTHNSEKDSYRLVVYSAESVPAFGPLLPCCGEFNDHIAFRDFLLAKLINSEKAAYCTPTFAEKRERTLSLLLKGFEQKCSTEYRRSVSSPMLHSPNQGRKNVEREQNFTEFGQRLKVEKIITGHHPTSQRTTVAPKRDPWETVSVADDFPYKITCGDTCDDGTLIVSTPSDGTYFIFRDGSYSMIIDSSVPIAQLVVAHRHQILLFRTNYNKEHNHLHAVLLREFYTEKIKIGTKSSISHYHIPYTKGCHLFCTAPLDSQFLRVAVAVKNKVHMLAYKHAATMTINGSPVTPVTSSNPMNSFIKHKELSLSDTPVHMTLLDERPSGRLCVSYQKQTIVDAVDEIRGTIQRIPNFDIAKAKLTTLTSVHSNGKSELLLGYNLSSQLITLNDGSAYSSVEMVWNAEPRDLVYMSPYILAFTANSVEIRMASNGSLMQTIQVPDLHLLSKKGDLYFCSSSNMLENIISRTPTSAKSNPSIPTKFPKNIDKRDFTASGRLCENLGMTYVYKITMENMIGRQDSFASNILRSGSDDSVSRTSISEVLSVHSEDIQSDTSSLDFVHPTLEETEEPLMMGSFAEESPPGRKGLKGKWEDAEYESGHRARAYLIGQGPSSTVNGIRHQYGKSHSHVHPVTGMGPGRTGMGHGSVVDTIALDSVVCSSPDSGVHDDFTLVECPRSTRMLIRAHHHSKSSPSLFDIKHS